jgi:cbb3-type cytochrome oxidase maturation protein
MEIIYVLIPISLVFLALAIWVLFWSVDSGQFDDLEGPAHSILHEEDQELIPTETQRPEKDKQK